jgi:hypothetical protein
LKGKATKPTKMYVRGGIVKKKGLHHWIENVWPLARYGRDSSNSKR